jgi:hypothetical protein
LKIDSILEGFINDPNKRLKNKNACPSLGDILFYITMSSKYKFQDIRDVYMEELMDR